MRMRKIKDASDVTVRRAENEAMREWSFDTIGWKSETWRIARVEETLRGWKRSPAYRSF
jgi:hypothetical protein